jgi:hypothetical protein
VGPRNPITGIAACCARAASGHAAADPAIAVRNSRRRIAFPRAYNPSEQEFATARSNQEFAPGDMGLMVSFALQQFKMAHVGSGSRAVLINRH